MNHLVVPERLDDSAQWTQCTYMTLTLSNMLLIKALPVYKQLTSDQVNLLLALCIIPSYNHLGAKSSKARGRVSSTVDSTAPCRQGNLILLKSLLFRKLWFYASLTLEMWYIEQAVHFTETGFHIVPPANTCVLNLHLPPMREKFKDTIRWFGKWKSSSVNHTVAV